MVQELFDKKLKFNKTKHSYTIDGLELRSVTSFISQFFEKFDARKVAKSCSFIPHNKEAKRGVRYFLKKWKEDSERGKRVHSDIERFIKGKIDAITLNSDPKSILAGKWINEKLIPMLERSSDKSDYFEIIPEVKIYSKDLLLAGTIDLLCVKKNDPKFAVLIDWKTNNKFSIEGFEGKKGTGPCSDVDDCHFSKYSLQLQLYAYILQKEYGFIPTDLYIVHIGDEKVTPYRVDFDLYRVKKVLDVKQ